MKKGFTTKELGIALFMLGMVIAIILPKISNALTKKEYAEIVNYSQLYIKKLNAQIITTKAKDEDILYKVKLPNKPNETVTFSINGMVLNNPQNYEGIIKVTYIDSNKYEYKIAIHNDKLMIGTISKPINENNINEDAIVKYSEDIFGKSNLLDY